TVARVQALVTKSLDRAFDELRELAIRDRAFRGLDGDVVGPPDHRAVERVDDRANTIGVATDLCSEPGFLDQHGSEARAAACSPAAPVAPAIRPRRSCSVRTFAVFAA